MKKFLRFTAMLALASAFCFAGCAAPAEEEKPGTTPETPETPEPEANPFEGYTVVYEADNASAESAARSIAQAAGDLTVASDAASAGDKEILVGEVGGREYSDYLSLFPREGGWDISAIDGDVYVTADGAYEQAAEAFAEIASEGLAEDASVVSENDYLTDSARIGNVPLCCYTITYTSGDAASGAAAYLQEWFEENTGYSLPLAEAGGEEEYTLLVGGTQAELGEQDCAVELTAGGAAICAGAADEVRHSAESFVAHFFRSGETDVRITSEGGLSYKCWEYLDTDYVRTQTYETQTIAEGVTYEKYGMENADGDPMLVYALEAKAGSGWQVRSAVHPDYTQKRPKLSTVLDTAQLTESWNTEVLFACNSGFFFMNTAINRPEGVLIVDGEMLSSAGQNNLGDSRFNFFGVTYDGEPVIGDYTELSATYQDLRYAVAGRGELLRGGELHDISYGWSDSLGENTHPRTAIGYRENGDIVIIVVDGRYVAEGAGPGANLCDLALLFKSYGCVSALNCDGGGSSTFVVREEDGTLAVKNNPSDGHLRLVGDCIVIVRERQA